MDGRVNSRARPQHRGLAEGRSAFATSSMRQNHNAPRIVTSAALVLSERGGVPLLVATVPALRAGAPPARRRQAGIPPFCPLRLPSHAGAPIRRATALFPAALSVM